MPGILVVRWALSSILIASSPHPQLPNPPETVTLRINMTGLMAYGPMGGVQEDTKSIWVLAAEASNYQHLSELRFGCDADGKDCEEMEPIKGYDLRLLVNEEPLALDRAKLRVDYSFRAHVGVLEELAKRPRPMGHHACARPIDELRLNGKRRPLHTWAGLMQPRSQSPPAAHLAKVAFRFRLAGGYGTDNEGRCDTGDHCGGKLSARDVAVCGRWSFSARDLKRCARFADTVVYELRVQKRASKDLTINFEKISHANGSSTILKNLFDGRSKTIDVWLINAPKKMTTMQHFHALYGLFPNDSAGQSQLPYSAIPEYDAKGYGNCNDLPGLKPVRCPGFVF